MSRAILERLANEALVALRCKGEAWGGALFAASLIPDTWVGLVVTPDGRRRFVPAGEDPDPRRDDTLVLVRNRAMTVPLAVADAPAADHPVSGAVELLVRWPLREDDLAALHQTLLADQGELTLDRLGAALERAGAGLALRAFVRGRSAGDLVHGEVRTTLCEHLRTELKAFLFTAGLVLERLGGVTFSSPSLDDQVARERRTARRLEDLAARDLVERTALAATQRRLDDLSGILGKLKAAAAEHGEMRWHALLPSLTPGERGRLLESLWRLTPDRMVTRAIVVVAGRECAWLDPADLQRPVRRVQLPDDLGGLRAVSFAPSDGALLVGAATGVWRLDAQTGEVRDRYVAPTDQPPRTGFNAAVIARGQLFATHSQLGAWSWPLDTPGDAAPLLRPIQGMPRTIRAVTTDAHGRVLLAADNRVHAFDLAGETAWQTPPTDGSVHALAALEEWLFAGTSTGALLRCDLNLRDAWLPVHRGHGAIESISARRWDDLVELVIPAGVDGVSGVYVGQGFVTRLLRTTLPIRRTWAADDALVALTDARDRLIVLTGSMPAGTGAEVPVARLLGHALQDACLVVAAAQ